MNSAAVQFRFLDRLIGTDHLPSGCGVGGYPVPMGYLRQLAYPFRGG